MTTRWTTLRTLPLGVLLITLITGCANKGSDAPPEPIPPGEPSEVPAGVPTDPARPSMTDAECESKGGQIVGDIGDGAIHRPDYVCAGGEKPIGSIAPAGDGPVAVEGSVCCVGG
ncbi:MAG: hypothetical protein R3B09_06450 [Nannocystaceae bacterium]